MCNINNKNSDNNIIYIYDIMCNINNKGPVSYI